MATPSLPLGRTGCTCFSANENRRSSPRNRKREGGWGAGGGKLGPMVPAPRIASLAVTHEFSRRPFFLNPTIILLSSDIKECFRRRHAWTRIKEVFLFRPESRIAIIPVIDLHLLNGSQNCQSQFDFFLAQLARLAERGTVERGLLVRCPQLDGCVPKILPGQFSYLYVAGNRQPAHETEASKKSNHQATNEELPGRRFHENAKRLLECPRRIERQTVVDDNLGVVGQWRSRRLPKCNFHGFLTISFSAWMT